VVGFLRWPDLELRIHARSPFRAGDGDPKNSEAPSVAGGALGSLCYAGLISAQRLRTHRSWAFSGPRFWRSGTAWVPGSIIEWQSKACLRGIAHRKIPFSPYLMVCGSLELL
jgi:hypothetical protein